MSARVLARVAVVACVGVVLAGCEPAAPRGGAAPTAGDADAATVAASLPVKGRAPATGYDRDKFPHWSDLDGDGCDADDEANREHADTERAPGWCRESAGRMVDPYSGADLAWGRSRAGIVDIDHVVPLKDAWVKGAAQWDDARREVFANDPLNLVPTSASLNRQKGGSDAASWLPPDKAARCWYVARQVAVKHRYGLWVTEAEKYRIGQVLGACPTQAIPTDVYRAPTKREGEPK